MFKVVIVEIRVYGDVQKSDRWHTSMERGLKRCHSVSQSLLHGCTSVNPARLHLSWCTSRMPWSSKACSTVAQVYIKPGTVPEGLLHYCAGVYLAGFILWQLVILLYWCTSGVTEIFLKLAVLLYRRTSLVCGWSAAPNAPSGKTRVRCCSGLPMPVAMWTTAGCTSKSIASSPRPTVPPAANYDSDDSLEAIRRQHNTEEGPEYWNPRLIMSIDAS